MAAASMPHRNATVVVAPSRLAQTHSEGLVGFSFPQAVAHGGDAAALARARRLVQLQGA